MKKLVVTYRLCRDSVMGKTVITTAFENAAAFQSWVRALPWDVVVLRWRQL